MPKIEKNIKQPVITLKIESGQVTPHQCAAWRRFWQKLIAECKCEVQNDR